MIFLKSFISRFLVISILSITFLNTFLLTSFADYRVGNPQKVASDSDARPEFDINDSDTYFQDLDNYFLYEGDGVSPIVDDLPRVNNTVHLNRIKARLYYYDMSHTVRSSEIWLSGRGYFSFTRPDDCASVYSIEFLFEDGSYPSKPGTYRLSMRFSSNQGVEYKDEYRFYQGLASIDNVSNSSSSKYFSGLRQSSGDFYLSNVIDFQMTSHRVFYPVIYFNQNNIFPYGGYVSASFERTSDTPDWSSNPYPPSSEDIQQDISNSVGNISSGVDNINNSINSGVDSINGNLEEIIRTISMQLEALWNQMYNLIHLDDNKNRDENTKKITDKLDQTNKNLDTIDTDILDGFENLEQVNSSNTNSIINNNNQNTSNIINNNNENTDKLANGYDNNSMLENNDKLSGKLDEYEKLEEELLKDTKDNLNNFQFDNPFLSFNAVMSDISYILTSIYNGLGSFNIPIAFSFTLTISMLCIGWYRFKGGT